VRMSLLYLMLGGREAEQEQPLAGAVAE